MALPSDAFEGLAEQCALQLEAQRLTMAPRDVLAPLAEIEQHYLVTLCREAAPGQVQLIFSRPLSDPSPPSVRDVLWWLASDAWSVARAGGELEQWSATYGYAAQAEATRRLFEQQADQASALAQLLGEWSYRRLLTLYEADLAESRSPG